MKNKIIFVILISILVIGVIWGTIREGSNSQTTYNINKTYNDSALAAAPNQLIRFHVLANSDSEQDQALKRAVRDAILEKVSPRLATAQTLEESRQILKQVRPEMEDIGRAVVNSWGKDYAVHTEYGRFNFPTKSYGSLVLPAGDYEALRVVIGKGQGSNWWCVLFPPLCFVDIDHSTAVQVDGKPGIPIKREPSVSTSNQTQKSSSGPVKVHFYFWELIKHLFFKEDK